MIESIFLALAAAAAVIKLTAIGLGVLWAVKTMLRQEGIPALYRNRPTRFTWIKPDKHA